MILLNPACGNSSGSDTITLIAAPFFSVITRYTGISLTAFEMAAFFTFKVYDNDIGAYVNIPLTVSDTTTQFSQITIDSNGTPTGTSQFDLTCDEVDLSKYIFDITSNSVCACVSGDRISGKLRSYFSVNANVFFNFDVTSMTFQVISQLPTNSYVFHSV